MRKQIILFTIALLFSQASFADEEWYLYRNIDGDLSYVATFDAQEQVAPNEFNRTQCDVMRELGTKALQMAQEQGKIPQGDFSYFCAKSLSN